MGQYFHSGTMRVSFLLGALVFAIALPVCSLAGLPKAVFAALLLAVVVALLASVFFPLRTYLRYKGIENSLPKPVLLKTDVGIRDDEALRGGYLYLTEDAIYLFARDRKPYAAQTLSKELVRGVIVEQRVYMTVKLANAARCILTSAQCDEILDLMREHGWDVD